MTSEAIILAGGFGTRLTSVKDIPKPMAPIKGKPFLEYILNYISSFNVSKVHLAVGYKYEVIQTYFGNNFNGLELNYVIEDNPLGTGGAIKKALEKVESNNVFIVNGDTFFELNFEELETFHAENNADVTLGLKPMFDFDRYGTVELDENNQVCKFSEKKHCDEGVINAGVYLLKRTIFEGMEFPDRFSIENDFFEKYYEDQRLFGFIHEGYFIDIGIPTDYLKAQKELPEFFL